MEKENNHNGGGNGFLLGIIVGVIIALLFTTKRGRQMLHILTEKGFERFSDIQDALVDDEDDEEGDDYVESVERPEVVHEASAQPTPVEYSEQQQAPKQIPASSNPSSSTGKRFFRKK